MQLPRPDQSRSRGGINSCLLAIAGNEHSQTLANKEHNKDRMTDTNQYYPVYEDTPHRITDLDGIIEKDYDSAKEIRKEVIFEDGSAFVLHNLLSRKECEAIRNQADKFGLIESIYGSRTNLTRQCNRVSLMSDALANLLFTRARPFLIDLEIHYNRKHNANEPAQPFQERGLEDYCRGKYSPYGLNPCFRVVKYNPGGFFYPHFDGGFAVSEEKVSLKTFMIYLNGSEDFEGGPTNIFNEKQKHYAKPLQENVEYAYHPQCGSCLVFNHRITHDGGKLLAGEKWLLRTEVMYEME